MAPIGAKLCQSAFQVIPDISFFDVEMKLLTIVFFTKILTSNPEQAALEEL